MKSVKLSLICTKVVIALMIICAAAMPKIMNWYRGFYTDYYSLPEINAVPLMVLFYSCCIPAAAILFSLHKLLINIKAGEVFIEKNVKLLRVISWGCFIAALILAVGTYYYIMFALSAVVVGFLGLILRVVKNVIEEAVTIKTENDLTI